jgi:hypothetical protein
MYHRSGGEHKFPQKLKAMIYFSCATGEARTGNLSAAQKDYAKLVSLCQYADVERPELKHARLFLK